MRTNGGSQLLQTGRDFAIYNQQIFQLSDRRGKHTGNQ